MSFHSIPSQSECVKTTMSLSSWSQGSQPSVQTPVLPSASLATAGDRDLIWRGENATPLTVASAPTAWAMDAGVSHDPCNERNRFSSMIILRQPLVIELGVDNKVTVNHHGHGHVSRESEVNTLYWSMFRLSIFSINPFDTTGYTSTFGRGKCFLSSASITITGNRFNDLYIISWAAALTSTSTLTNSTSRRRKWTKERASSSTHTSVPQSEPPTGYQIMQSHWQSPNHDCGIAA
jgi:hypothetical protein